VLRENAQVCQKEIIFRGFYAIGGKLDLLQRICIFNFRIFSDKNIFISPLDWGLGHATRCVPIIRGLEKNNNVIIGITPLTKSIFEEEFPALQKISLPSYNISYSMFFPLWMKLSAEWPRIAGVIRSEKKTLSKIIDAHEIDIVISDNRFGLHSSKARSIFITHQIFVKTPFAQGFAHRMNKNYIMNFDEVWIPDHEDEEKSLSGELSHGKHFHSGVKYIGPQSRLQKISSENKFDHLFLISGPEPQRSAFEDLLLEKAAQFPHLKFALARHGSTKEKKFPSNLSALISPDKLKLSEIISQSKTIVCRSGYSTLMDLHLLGKTGAILVPTPGQTEQEYLAEHWKKKFNCEAVTQNDLKKFVFR
jgi:hypothetical protein